MTVQPMPKRIPKPQRSHEEIYDLITVNSRKADDAVHRTDMLTEVVQRVEGKLDALLKSMGSEAEDERGTRVGTGVVGRLMRLETSVAKRFSQYDGWVKLVVGFTAAVAVAAPIIWWLVSSKLEVLLK